MRGRSIFVNVLAKVPKFLKLKASDEMRSIFYAPACARTADRSSYKKAKEFFNEFKNKWKESIPSAVKCLENSIEKCLTFYQFPEEEWISFRTTNAIERLNKEFKRRTKPMEIVIRRKYDKKELVDSLIISSISFAVNPD